MLAFTCWLGQFGTTFSAVAAEPLFDGGPLEFLLQILMTFLTIMEFAIIGRALISWFDRGMTNPISQILVQITEPIIAPIRRVVPSAGMLDLSPMVAILLILVLQRMLSTALA